MRHVTGLIITLACFLGLSGPAAAKVLKFEITRVESPAFEALIAKAAERLVDAKLFVPGAN